MAIDRPRYPSLLQINTRVLLTALTGDLGRPMSDASYDRDGNEIASRGLFLDVPPWAFHVFEVSSI